MKRLIGNFSRTRVQSGSLAGHVGVMQTNHAIDISILDTVDVVPATREGILIFARLMTAQGTALTIGQTNPLLNALRIVTDVPDAPDTTLAFLSVVDGEPEVTTLDFDFGGYANRHLLHTDGLGLTLCNHLGQPVMHYRIGA